jgi:predicted nuclease of predicted toxin-antitoxin system
MKLYLDDDIASRLLTKLLRNAGHDVQIPAEAGKVGDDDPEHPLHAVRTDRVCLTQNHDDFENLHKLIVAVGGHYPGLLVVRKDNDPKRDLTPQGIVRAIATLLKAGVPVRDQFLILNHWR